MSAKSEEIKKRREAMREVLAKAKEAQNDIDMDRVVELEEQYGYERIVSIKLPAWDPSIGGPTLVAARVPKSSEAIMKRFEQELNNSKEGSPQRVAARNSLARACLVYPDPDGDKETFDKVMDSAPGVLANVALVVIQKAQGIAEEKGKD